MRIFMGLIMVMIVAGNDEPISGVELDSVLLPCNCSNSSLEKGIKWQLEEPEPAIVFITNTNVSVDDRYKGRVRMVPDRNNCSILLTNITAEDHGKYRCSFSTANTYQKSFVNLHISVRYNVCQRTLNNSQNVFNCAAHGRYGAAEVQWILDGQILKNSPKTNITPTEIQNVSLGLFSLTSNLSMTLNDTSKLVCDVKANGRSTIITRACEGETGSSSSAPLGSQPKDRYRYSKIISITMMLGFLLFLWRRR